MVDVPVATPVTTPPETVAFVVLLLLHTPPETASVSETVEVTHTAETPVIVPAEAEDTTVTVFVAAVGPQPFVTV